MAFKFPHPHFGGGGRERETPEQFKERKRRALGWHVELPDQVQQQLNYIAGDLSRFPDEAIAGEIDVLFKDRTLEERSALVGRVQKTRYPEQPEGQQ